MSFVPPLVNGLTGQVTTLLTSLPTQFSFAGNQATFTQVAALTGAFISVQAASGSFSTLQAGTYINASGTQLTQTSAAFVGSLVAGTGSGQQTFTPVTFRGVTPTFTGTNVTSVTLGPGWSKAAYSVCVTVPPASTVTAQCLFAGTVLADSVAAVSNIAPTVTLGMVTAVPQTSTLSGFAHWSAATTGAFTVTITSSTGTGFSTRNGSVEVMQLQ